MDFDESKKIDVEISENEFVENRVDISEPQTKRPRRRFHVLAKNRDVIDYAIIPVTLCVFLSLGFLFANILRIPAVSAMLQEAALAVSSIV